MDEAHGRTTPPRGRRLAALALGSLGVVYGDIGTSPLYAMRETFAGHLGVPLDRANVLGVLSLMIWSLLLVVTLKYLAVILRADNHGEGGILALMALVMRTDRGRWAVVAVGLFGAALLYGDGMITPAISVLGAVEGLAVHQPALEPFILPGTLLVLGGLFFVQRRGTGGLGALFGPFTLLWFVVLAVLGLRAVALEPDVLWAFDPRHAARFFVAHGWHGVLVLGGVFLVVTGGEALYADMGHFGARPIRLAWFAVALPALLANYLGQGALLLQDPSALENPFYRLAPAWAVLPLVVLSTGAACIASQAVISGAFSLTRQAVQLGFFPRVRIVHTSAGQIGQIYVPVVNWALLVAVVLLVGAFRSSSALAAAYGIAVSSTMGLTTSLAYLVARELWGWSRAVAGAVFGAFLALDVAFLVANAAKFLDGGWVPVVIALGIFLGMTTWKRGRTLLAERVRAVTLPLDELVRSLRRTPPPRVPGTAVFMTGNPDGTPPALLHNLKHNKALHERNVLLTIETTSAPTVRDRERYQVEALPDGFHRVRAWYGFMETPDVPALIRLLAGNGLPLRLMETSFFLGRETLIAGSGNGMVPWRKRLFGWMNRNAQPATAFFNLPANRVVELGAQVEL